MLLPGGSSLKGCCVCGSWYAPPPPPPCVVGALPHRGSCSSAMIQSNAGAPAPRKRGDGLLDYAESGRGGWGKACKGGRSAKMACQQQLLIISMLEPPNGVCNHRHHSHALHCRSRTHSWQSLCGSAIRLEPSRAYCLARRSKSVPLVAVLAPCTMLLPSMQDLSPTLLQAM